MRPPFCSRISKPLHGGVLRRSPGQRERLHHRQSLRWIHGKSARPDHIANHVDQPRAAHLHGVAGAQFRVVVEGCVGSAGVQHHRMRRLGIARGGRRSPDGPRSAPGRKRPRSGRAADGAACRDRRRDAPPRPARSHPARRRRSPAPKPADAAAFPWPISAASMACAAACSSSPPNCTSPIIGSVDGARRTETRTAE